MDFWRRSSQVSWLDYIINERIREIIELDHTVLDTIKSKSSIWCRHLQRMPEDRWAKKIWQRTRPGRRKLRRRSWRRYGCQRSSRARLARPQKYRIWEAGDCSSLRKILAFTNRNCYFKLIFLNGSVTRYYESFDITTQNSVSILPIVSILWVDISLYNSRG